MESKTAFIFPAFITEFTGKEIDFLESNSINIDHYIKWLAEFLNKELPGFSYNNPFYLEELNSQLLAYTMSCTMNNALNKKGITPGFIAGYSMGIYAALYASKSITFELGAELILEAYNLVKHLAEKGSYGMGAIIGLSYIDIENLISINSLSVEIINVNNEHSMVIAGLKADIKSLLEIVKEEGALTTAELTVNTPYHSKYLEKFSEPFSVYLEGIEIKQPTIPIISTYDQRGIISAKEIKKELMLNLTQKINWYKTMQKLIELGVNDMYECGAGKDLKKISRFIHGEYKLRPVYKA